MRRSGSKHPIERYGWNEWLCKSNFSFLRGASYPLELLQQAAAFGYRGLLLADYDGVYGLARAFRARKQLSERSPRLFYGAEVHLQADHHLPLVQQDTLVLLAQNLAGYGRLCRLLTQAQQQGKARAFLSLSDLLASNVSGLVCIQPMRGLVRMQADLLRVRADSAPTQTQVMLRQRYAALNDHFQKRFYLTVSRHGHPGEDIWIATVLAQAKALAIPLLGAQDAFFHSRQRKALHDVLLAMYHNCTIKKAKPYLFANGERCLHSLHELEAQLGALPGFEQMLRNSVELAASCQFDLAELHYRYPKEMIPQGMTSQEFLRLLVKQGVQERFGSGIDDKINELLTKELALIAQLDFADYFLTVWDIVAWARGQGILCQGRGSAANSAVCFVLGITNVDPRQFDLLFERFLSVERGDPPDIDVDFEHERREEVIHYIYRRFGRDRAAMVANVITFRLRSSLRFVGKALGISELVLGQATALAETREQRSQGIASLISRLQQQQHQPRQAIPAQGMQRQIPWKKWAQLAQQVLGFPHHLGIHSGGFVLADRSLSELCAVEPATMEGRTVIQWNKDDIEALNFFKVDILSLGALTAIRKTLGYIRQQHGVVLDLATLPRDDARTFAMIQRAETVGTFQIESRAQMSMLPRLRPRSFYDLVIQVAIIRPGPIQGKMVHPFLRRRAGLDPVSFPDERLRPILARTLGVPIFQEQVMRIAMVLGGFSGGEANELRRHLSAFSISADNLSPLLQKLKSRMELNNTDPQYMQQLLQMISEGFAHYGFPESHAASFAFLAYVSSYLKAHYPLEFYTGILNAQPMGFYSPHALLHTARLEGVRVLPLCLWASQWDHSIEDGALRLGLRMIAYLQREKMQRFIAWRLRLCQQKQQRPSLTELLRQMSLSRSELTALAAADALQIFGVQRRQALWLAAALPYSTLLEAPEEVPFFFASSDQKMQQMTVSAEMQAAQEVYQRNLQAIKAETLQQRVANDFKATGTSLLLHPAQLLKELKDAEWPYLIARNRLLTARQLAVQATGSSVHVFGMVQVRQSPPTAKGVLFITLEDETGFMNLLLPAAIYRRYQSLIDGHAFLCVSGRLQRHAEAHVLMTDKVHQPRDRGAQVHRLVDSEGQMTHEVGSGQPYQQQWAPSRNYQ